MKWKLSEEKAEGKKTVRIYTNEATNGEIKTSLIYTDEDGGKWWGFTDLFKIPIIRTAMARHIMDLFQVGLSRKDILDWCTQEKVLLKSDDSEKYEKLYKLILEKEQIVNYTANPVKQSLALATVYVLADDERIDYFDDELSASKMKVWAGNTDMTAFFLNWHNDHTLNYLKGLEKISKTVSRLEKMSGKNLP